MCLRKRDGSVSAGVTEEEKRERVWTTSLVRQDNEANRGRGHL